MKELIDFQKIPLEKKNFILHNIIRHLSECGSSDKLDLLLLNFSYIEAKLKVNFIALLDDYNITNNRQCKIVEKSLTLSKIAIEKDIKHLPSQLYGRLLSYDDEKLKSLLNQIKHVKLPWLRLLKNSLTQANENLHISFNGKGFKKDFFSFCRNYIVSYYESHITIYNIVNRAHITIPKIFDFDKILFIGLEAELFLYVYNKEIFIFSIVNKTIIPVKTNFSETSNWVTNDNKKIYFLYDKNICALDAVTGNSITVIKSNSILNNLAISPDGLYIAANSEENIKIWNALTGKKIWDYNTNNKNIKYILMIANFLAIGSDLSNLCNNKKNRLSKYLLYGEKITISNAKISIFDFYKNTLVTETDAIGDEIKDLIILNDYTIKGVFGKEPVSIINFLNRSLYIYKDASDIDNELKSILNKYIDGTSNKIYLFEEILKIIEPYEDEIKPTVIARKSLLASIIKNIYGMLKNEERPSDSIQEWNLKTGELKKTTSFMEKSHENISLLGNGSYIFTKKDSSIKIHDMSIQTLPKEDKFSYDNNLSFQEINSIAITPNCKYIIVTSGHITKIFDFETKKLIKNIDHTEKLADKSFGKYYIHNTILTNGSFFVTETYFSRSNLRYFFVSDFDIDKSDKFFFSDLQLSDWILANPPVETFATKVNYKGQLLTNHYGVKIPNINLIFSSYTIIGYNYSKSTYPVSVSNDGRIAISSGSNGIAIWRPGEKEPRYIYGDISEVERGESGNYLTYGTPIGITPDNQNLILSCDWGGFPSMIWLNLETGKSNTVLIGCSSYESSIMIEDGRDLLCADSGRFVIRDAETSDIRWTFYTEINDDITALTASNNGYITVIAYNKYLVVWDLRKELNLVSFYFDFSIIKCAIAPDKKNIIVGDESGQIHFLYLENISFENLNVIDEL